MTLNQVQQPMQFYNVAAEELDAEQSREAHHGLSLE